MVIASMDKLISGIVDFRKNTFPSRREIFKKLAMGQSPDALFITCSDSRVAPNWFASTDPGDLFVIRNVGNLVPPHTARPLDFSVGAALDFSLTNLNVGDIIVCGHSECGAMNTLHRGVQNLPNTHLKTWMAHAEPALNYAGPTLHIDPNLAEHNQISQKNVMVQIGHLESNPQIAERRKDGKLRLHAWWFSIAEGGVYALDHKTMRYTLIDENLDAETISRLQNGLPFLKTLS
jgi:carbonic anhydrase